MVRKSSSWASWSSTNFEEVDGDRLEDIQQQLNERARSNIRRLPANVEPGFEDQYVRKHRSLNSRYDAISNKTKYFYGRFLKRFYNQDVEL
jgi:hypothetical protein